MNGAAPPPDRALEPPLWTLPGAALLLIDLQNDFAHAQGAFPIPGIGAVLARLVLLRAEFRRAGRPVLYTRHISDPATNPIELLLFPRMAGGGLRAGTWGAELCADLAPAPGEAVIVKNRFDAFIGTDLEQRLRRAGATDLVIGGCQTHICCETTARAASCRDFRTVLLADGCISRRPRLHRAALALFASAFGRVVRTPPCAG